MQDYTGIIVLISSVQGIWWCALYIYGTTRLLNLDGIEGTGCVSFIFIALDIIFLAQAATEMNLMMVAILILPCVVTFLATLIISRIRCRRGSQTS